MATGAGKTFTTCTFSWRLLKHAGARRILFLVDRNNLGDQTLKEFQNYEPPGSGRKFTQTYIVQHLHSNHIDKDAKLVITTIQRLYAMLRGEELDEASEEGRGDGAVEDLAGPSGGLFVDDADLQPGDLRADPDRVLDDRGDVLGLAKDVDDVDPLRHVEQARVALLAEDFSVGRVHGDHTVAVLLQILARGRARADAARRADVIGRDRVAENAEHARAFDV